MFSPSVYTSRRNRLSKRVESGLMLFIGNQDAPYNYLENQYPFRQDSTFLYLFGLNIAGIAATIDADTGESILFMDNVSGEDIIWMGQQPDVVELASKSGVTEVRPLRELESVVMRAVSLSRPVHYVPPYRGETVLRLSSLLGKSREEILHGASVELIKAMVALREIKEPCEIEELDRHMSVSREMHLTAMRMAHEGHTEQDVRAAIESVSLKGGGMVSFPTICTVHGETLHNHGYTNDLKNGQLLLVDAGSESPEFYATDNTRTTPIGGKFSQMQRDIYQIVLDANNAVAASCEPGISYKEVHLFACRVIAQGLMELGLMKGSVEDAVAEGAHALFMPHGIGHMLGLDVHDMESYNQNYVGFDDEVRPSEQFGLSSLRLGKRLKEGFVVTDEPGIYFIPTLIDKWKAEGICKDFINFDKLEAYRTFGGIRLEDDLLITRRGCRVMGDRIPIEVEDVEREANYNENENYNDNNNENDITK